MHLNDIIIGGAERGKVGGSNENTTNLQEGVTKGGTYFMMGMRGNIVIRSLNLEPRLDEKNNKKMGNNIKKMRNRLKLCS